MMRRKSRNGTGRRRTNTWPSNNSLCRGFKKDCPGGLLSQDKVLEMYTMILPEGNAKNFVEQIFRVFDKDGDGTIDFKVKFSG